MKNIDKYHNIAPIYIYRLNFHWKRKDPGIRHIDLQPKRKRIIQES